jgi:hypothetical protein
LLGYVIGIICPGGLGNGPCFLYDRAVFADDDLGNSCPCLYELKRQVTIGSEEDVLRLGMQDKPLIAPDYQDEEVIGASDC